MEQLASHMKPDAFIIAGDIRQSGKRSEFEAARPWFDSLGAAVISATGNHDTPVNHLPARMMAPFDRYERHLESMDIVGQIRNFDDGLVRISAINSARGFQGRINWADGVIDLRNPEDAPEKLSKEPGNAWRLLICHHRSTAGACEIGGGEATRRRSAEAVRSGKIDAIITGYIHDAFTIRAPRVRRPMVQMGSGVLSTRLRTTRPSFCVIQIDGEHMVQDAIVIGPNGAEIRRNSASALNSGSETMAGTQSLNAR